MPLSYLPPLLFDVAIAIPIANFLVKFLQPSQASITYLSVPVSSWGWILFAVLARLPYLSVYLFIY
ncbi:hypothetical protein BDV12DRAFT_164588 [Aspergillus spectabilis]